MSYKIEFDDKKHTKNMTLLDVIRIRLAEMNVKPDGLKASGEVVQLSLFDLKDEDNVIE